MSRSTMNPDNREWERVDENMILVMRLTGAGKSYFIQQLTGMNVSVGHELKVCMSFPSISRIFPLLRCDRKGYMLGAISYIWLTLSRGQKNVKSFRPVLATQILQSWIRRDLMIQLAVTPKFSSHHRTTLHHPSRLQLEGHRLSPQDHGQSDGRIGNAKPGYLREARRRRRIV
jgi:hypothetical protein